ncbi:MAG: ORF6N domain-containing protein [Bacteroidaceae bacterium]|nr:ORF6N domain-containing protein [Bacteroidaceae bacterium]
MNDIVPIQQFIFEIRGQRVMLDRDLAMLYGVETSQLKRAVRRNMRRFEGDDFMIVLSHEEILRCQIGTSSWGGSRYGAFAFTELGVAMLSSVLSSETAIDINRKIMRAFVAIRQALPALATQKDIEDLRLRVKALEESGIATQAAVEETKEELSHVYEAITQLGDKRREPLPEIDYDAIQKRIDEENRKKKLNN